MKFRALLLSLILAAGVIFSASAFAADDQKDDQKKIPAPTEQTQQPADPTKTQPAGTPDQTQPAAKPEQTQAQPAATPADPSQPQTGPQTTPADQSTPDAATAPGVKHPGGKDDVDAVGNRKMGGMDWYSIEKEVRMGKEYAMQIEQSMRMVKDPVVVEYVNRIGQNLVRNSDAKVPFTIKVVDSDEVNAFALPGGFFYVNTGLILAADEEAELAGVMAHEIAHVAARHATRGATRAQLANILTIPLIFVGGVGGYLAREAVGIALPVTFLSFSRGFEAEADYLGLQYMYKAGYDPNAFVAFFEKLASREKKKPGTLAKAFATHPQTPDRIAKSQQEIASILPPRDQYIVSTSEFDQVKARLAMLENRHKAEDSNTKKPTLRRTSSNDKTGKDGKDDKSGDDRPTLHRRDQ